MKNYTKGNISLVILIIVGIVAISASSYYLGKTKNTSTDVPTTQGEVKGDKDTTSTPTQPSTTVTSPKQTSPLTKPAAPKTGTTVVSPITTGVKGVVWYGPTSATCQHLFPNNCITTKSEPLYFYGTNPGGKTASAKSAADGTYAVELPPGDYLVTNINPATGACTTPGPTCSKMISGSRFSVFNGEVTKNNIILDGRKAQ